MCTSHMVMSQIQQRTASGFEAQGQPPCASRCAVAIREFQRDLLHGDTKNHRFTMRQEPCCWDEMRRSADCQAARQAFVSGATHNPALNGTRTIVEGAVLATPRSCPWLRGTPHVKAWVALAVCLTSNPKHPKHPKLWLIVASDFMCSFVLVDIVPCETWFCRVRRRLSV